MQNTFSIPDYSNGTAPVADIFWYCGEGTQLQATLKPGWTGICAIVVLTGPLVIIALTHKSIRQKREILDSNIWITVIVWLVGVPEEHSAMSGAAIDYGAIFPWMQTRKNSHGINYLWYNKQRFINYTVQALEPIKEELHATSTMVMQNRFILDAMLAEEQGVCEHTGKDCCTVIPMHTGKEANITKALDLLGNLKDEYIRNTQGTTQSSSWGDWLFSSSSKATPIRLGTVFLLVVAIHALNLLYNSHNSISDQKDG